MTRALIAARKSTKIEGGREGHSLHTQDQYAREFCERLAWEVVGAAADTISGRVAPIDRKSLGTWLAEPTRFDVIVAYRSDRLSRGNQEDWTRIERWATENRKTLVMVDSGTGIRYPARDDSDYWQWTAAKRQSGQEWEAIRERNIRSQTALVASGSVVTAPAFGYRISGERYAKRFAIYEPEAALVREAFERVTRGESLREVAAWLTKATGRHWKHTSVRGMILNPVYTGRMERNGQQFGECPPIVSMSEWVAARKAMAARVKRSAGGKPSVEPALMVMVCNVCGMKMYRGGARGNYTYYCSGAHGFGVSVEWADDWVTKRVKSSTMKEKRHEVIKGRHWADEIEALKRDRRQAMERDDEDAVHAIWAKIRELEARETEPDRVELRETKRTYGQIYSAMSDDEFRRALREWTIIADPEKGIKLGSPVYQYEQHDESEDEEGWSPLTLNQIASAYARGRPR